MAYCHKHHHSVSKGIGCGECAAEAKDRTNILEQYRGKNRVPPPQSIPESTAHGSEKFHALLKELGALHDKKQGDYGRDGNPFANVKAAEEWGVEPWVGAMVRATDKVRRLQSYAIKGTLSNEGARDSFQDLAVYALIALILWEENNCVKLLDKEGENGSD